MRTKTLLCMAALAAGVATSMAQNVYSLNIVGYANVPAPHGFAYMSNPFNTGVTNGALEVIPNPTGQWDTCEIHEWLGTGFKVSVFDSNTDDTTTGFLDRNFNVVPVPLLSSGKGYLFNNPGTSNNITYVGTVRTGTNTITIVGSSVPSAVGSPLPYAGNPGDLGFTNPAPSGPLDTVELEQLVVAPNGNAQGYKVSVFDSNTDDTTTGFIDRNFNTIPAPTFKIGEGFFIHNPNASPVVWTQVLNP